MERVVPENSAERTRNALSAPVVLELEPDFDRLGGLNRSHTGCTYLLTAEAFAITIVHSPLANFFDLSTPCVATILPRG